MKYSHLLAAVALVAGLAACSDLTGPSGSVNGRYVLRTVNGAYLPYGIGQDNNTGAYVEVYADTMWLDPSGSYEDRVTFRNSYNDGTVNFDQQIEDGTWTANNGSIQFYDQTDGGVTYQGSLSGSILTEIAQGYTQVYARQ